MTQEITFAITPEQEITLHAPADVFQPNLTTELLIDAVIRKVSAPARVLDLGCGTGVVGCALFLQGLVQEPLCASDISDAAVACSRKNFARHGCEADLRAGSLFAPWSEQKFDLVVDDISGIAEDVARASSWFAGVPCDSGKDGTALAAEIMRDAPRHLRPGGMLFFPVLSLSNGKALLRIAGEQFRLVEQVIRKQWPLPDELKQHLPLLQALHEAGAITLEERFGMILCSTEIYCASDPV